MTFQHWPIARKLTASFTVLIVILALQGLFVLQNFGSVQETLNKRSRGFAVMTAVLKIENAFLAQVNATRGVLLDNDPEFRARYESVGRDLDGQIEEAIKTTVRPITKQRLQATRQAIHNWRSTVAEPLMAMAAQPQSRAEAQRQGGIDRVGPVRQQIVVLVKGQKDRLDELSALIDVATVRMKTVLWGGAITAVIAALVLAWLLTLGIARPIQTLTGSVKRLARGDFDVDCQASERSDEIGELQQALAVFRDAGLAKQQGEHAKAESDAAQKQVVDTLSANLSHLAQGDLTSTITAQFPPAYAGLKEHYNDAVERLRGLIGSVSESAMAIRTGSDEIAQASEDLARRTESNAASLEETSNSITRMDERLRATADASSRTVARADQAISTVNGGRAVADEAVQAMGRVSESAKGIDSVIEGLDKIAFQTRVLAMNAAVEAGRAGDAGRGFAVVADLVSALAMRSEEEAKRAREQLTATQSDIITAVGAVQKVDGALSNISGDVAQVHELLATMAADNQAQASAISQVTTAIGSMDRATQQNAAMVEETSAAARNLASEVGGLADKAAQFNTGSAAAPRTMRAASRPALQPDDFNRPVRPLPAAAVPALVASTGDDGDWTEF
ncbi:methyl-accepting chemotaxis protein [Sphingomonas sp. SORGH_AS802]|uniref:methyl-accepting chemotaxis protein n=1 Tax=unclassified Sphingomonas TaxID=196159 RepID=UPI0028550F7B|nr:MULTISPECIES: methyl-accepting chemotaxis protein [unclassified Sphingomonas]MDR6126031.1 methyl-accepting chemotaxis protein [Sphingomonas sp. SORGH_AS_0438]MDR6136550.1 methyl-accepting chemotaxis protein [Sphingomonas sp. SORGH_AS_0802]